MNVARPRRWRSCCSWRRVHGAGDAYVTPDSSVANVFENCTDEALDLQDHRCLGQSRRIDAAVGVDPALFGGLVAAFGNKFAAVAACACAGGAGLIAAAFYLFIPVTSNLFCASPTR
jgi:hypothetical protein